MDPNGLRRLNTLIEECRRHPFTGTGKPEGLKGNLQLVEEKLEVAGGEHKSTGVIVRMAQGDIKQNSNPFKLIIKSDGEVVNTVKLVFNGPVFD